MEEDRPQTEPLSPFESALVQRGFDPFDAMVERTLARIRCHNMRAPWPFKVSVPEFAAYYLQRRFQLAPDPELIDDITAYS